MTVEELASRCQACTACMVALQQTVLELAAREAALAALLIGRGVIDGYEYDLLTAKARASIDDVS